MIQPRLTPLARCLVKSANCSSFAISCVQNGNCSFVILMVADSIGRGYPPPVNKSLKARSDAKEDRECFNSSPA